MISESLKAQLDRGEDRTTVFVAEPTNREAIARSVCALLNGEGGAVLCGVQAGGEVVGKVGDLVAIQVRLEGWLREAITPTPLITVDLDSLGGEAGFLTVEVPQGPDAPYVFDGAVFVRDGGKTVTANAVVMRELLVRSSPISERWERRLSPSMDIEDLDREEVLATIREAEKNGRFSFSRSDNLPGDGDLAALRELSMWSPEGFTQAADVLFSKSPERRHPQCRVQFVRFVEDKASDEYEDNRWFSGPLARVFLKVLDALDSSNRVRSRFHQGEARREDRVEYASAALREGLVNAFVHRDYESYSGGLKVLIYPARIEIWNSGSLPEGLSPSDLKGSHPSIPTNPDIAQVFRLRNLMERTGRGTEKIFDACKAIGAPPPRWDDQRTGVTLTLFSALTPQPSEGLNPRQEQLLETLKVGEVFSLALYHDRFAREVSPRQARRDLQVLEELGILRREGAGPATVYRRN